MESASPVKDRKPGDILLTPRVLARGSAGFLRKQRDVQYHTLIFDLIARQFEAARLDEAKASPVIQVLDPAEPPDRKSSPYRALWALIGGVLGFLYGCGRVIGSYVYSRVVADEMYAQKLGQFDGRSGFAPVNGSSLTLSRSRTVTPRSSFRL